MKLGTQSQTDIVLSTFMDVEGLYPLTQSLVLRITPEIDYEILHFVKNSRKRW